MQNNMEEHRQKYRSDKSKQNMNYSLGLIVNKMQKVEKRTFGYIGYEVRVVSKGQMASMTSIKLCKGDRFKENLLERGDKDHFEGRSIKNTFLELREKQE